MDATRPSQSKKDPMSTSRGLYRSREHKIIAGVAAGLAERFGIPIWLMRFFWIILLLPGGIPGLLPYIILWVIIPLEPRDG
jgi:phage shock protein PspC (stress-responsive transcriptional regulator)